MLKRIVFFAVIVIMLAFILGRPGRDPIAVDTVVIPRAQLYARFNRDFTDVEDAAKERAAHAVPGTVPVTIRVTREDGRVLDLLAESDSKKVQIKVWLDDTGSPATTDLEVKMDPDLLWEKARKGNAIDIIETTLLRMSNELRGGGPVDSVFGPLEPPRPQH